VLSDLFKYYLLLIALLFFIAGIGILITYTQRSKFKNSNLYFFSALTIGSIIIVIATSIITTNFKTVYSIALILLTFLLFNLKKKSNSYTNNFQNDIINKRAILFFLLESTVLATIIFLFYYLNFSRGKSIFIDLPHPDHYFYSRLSSNFLKYHSENFDFTFSSSTPSPYHYFDIWLNTFSSIINKNCLLNYIFITTPLLLVVCYWGLKSLISEIFKNDYSSKIKVIAFSISGIFISGIYINSFYNDTIFSDSSVFCRNVINYSKLLPIYISLIWCVYFLIEKKEVLFYITVGFICINYSSAFIPISIFAFIIFIANLIRNKKLLPSNVLYTIATVIFVFLFYYFFSNNNDVSINQVKRFNFFLSIQHVRTLINIFFKTNLEIVLLYFFVPIIFIINYHTNLSLIKKYKYQVFILIALYLSAILSWMLFCNLIDSVQLFSNIAIPLLNILCLLFISYNLKLLVSSKSKIIISVILCAIIFQNIKYTYFFIKPSTSYSEISLAEFKNKIYPSITNKKIAYLKSPKKLSSIFSASPNFSIIAPQLLLIDNFDYISLSIFDSESLTKENEDRYIKNIFQFSPFYKFSEKNSLLSKEELKVKYILDNKIELLIANDDVSIPSQLKNKVKISINDTVGKVTYYLLDI